MGSIHGGTKHNIIPDEVKLQLTLRTFSEPVRLQLIESIKRIAASCRGKMIEGVGISLPGRVNFTTDRLAFAPNLKWQNVDIRNPIVKATGLEVELENAANACVLATVWFDRNETHRNMVVVTVKRRQLPAARYCPHSLPTLLPLVI